METNWNSECTYLITRNLDQATIYIISIWIIYIFTLFIQRNSLPLSSRLASLLDEYLIFILLVNALNQLGHEMLGAHGEFDRS